MHFIINILYMTSLEHVTERTEIVDLSWNHQTYILIIATGILTVTMPKFF